MSNEPYKTAERQQNFFLVVAAIFGLLMIFTAGTNAHDNKVLELVSNLVIGALFLGTVVIAVISRNQELRAKLAAKERDEQMRIRNEEARRIADGVHNKVDQALAAPAPSDEPKKDALTEVLDKIFEPIVQHQEDIEALSDVAEELGFADREPRREDFEPAAKLFTEKTGRYIQFIASPDGKFGLKFGAKPYAELVVEGKPAADAEVTTTTTTKRKLSPAQQRKKNEKAGHGRITDAELKAKRAAERKLAREAKKAQKSEKNSDTTTTTTTVVE